MDTPTILHIDDLPDEQQCVKDTFEEAYFPNNVVSAASAEDAIRLLEGKSVDLLILDLDLGDDATVGVDKELFWHQCAGLFAAHLLETEGAITSATPILIRSAYNELSEVDVDEYSREMGLSFCNTVNIISTDDVVSGEHRHGRMDFRLILRALRALWPDRIPLVPHHGLDTECILGTRQLLDDIADRVFTLVRGNTRAGTRVFCIAGETGVGKELYAHFLASLLYVKRHDTWEQASSELAEHFTARNSADFQGRNPDVEVFGSLSGAFTGAVDKAGLLHEKAKGLILFDEFDSFPKALQAKFLRVIQQFQFHRVGDNDKGRPLPEGVTLVFVVGALQPITDAVSRDSFRRDLWFRLDRRCIPVPPLRKSPHEIEQTGKVHLLKMFPVAARNHGVPVDPDRAIEEQFPVDPQVWNWLCSQPWSGNRREFVGLLDSAVSSMFEAARPKSNLRLTVDHLVRASGQDVTGAPAAQPDSDLNLLTPGLASHQRDEARLILDCFDTAYENREKNGGVVFEIAQKLYEEKTGKKKSTFRRRIDEYFTEDTKAGLLPRGKQRT